MTDPATDWLTVAEAAMPLVAALIAAILAIPAYLINARINRNETLLAKRREVFATYVTAVQLNMIGQREPAIYQEAYANIFIYGTDDVIRAVSAFHEEMADKAGQIDGTRAADAYARMVLTMRADCFASSKLSLPELKTLLPFKYQ